MKVKFFASAKFRYHNIAIYIVTLLSLLGTFYKDNITVKIVGTTSKVIKIMTDYERKG